MCFSGSEDISQLLLLSRSSLFLRAEMLKISRYTPPSAVHSGFLTLSAFASWRLSAAINIQIVSLIISVERDQFLRVLLVR